MTPSSHAERALLDERRPLTRDEVLAVAALPLDELPTSSPSPTGCASRTAVPRWSSRA